MRVVQAYLNVLRAQDRLDATLAREAAVNRQLEQVQQRFDVGLVAITDVLEAQAGYDSTVVDRIQADGDRYIFFETLQALIGESFESLDRISDNLPVIDPQPQNEEQWVQTALETNHNIAAARAQLEAANRSIAPAGRGTCRPWTAQSRAATTTPAAPAPGQQDQHPTYALSVNLAHLPGRLHQLAHQGGRALAEQAREELLNQQLSVSRDTRNLSRWWPRTWCGWARA